MIDEASQSSHADAGPVERPVRRYPLELVCLHSEDCSTLMSKGHHEPDEFLSACLEYVKREWDCQSLKDFGRVRHGWHRTVPDQSGEYTWLMVPAKPHTPGAFPTTCIVDNKMCDFYA